MYYVYVLQSKKDGKWYTGSTGDLRKRFKEHNNGKAFSTKNRRPLELIYYEACINEDDARMREKYLKSGPGKKYLNNRMKRSLSLTGFTIIELLIVVAIILMLSGLGGFIGVDFYRSYVLNSEQDTLVSILMRARNMTQANINQASHGVYIAGATYTVFQGNSYAARNVAYDEVTNMNPSVVASGLQEVVFSELDGSTGNSGDIILSNRNRFITISLNSEGRINW